MTIEGGMKARTSSSNSLLIPFHYKSLNMRNRFVMAPMTRNFSPNGIPTAEVAAYYRRRAEGNVGLILSEGTIINRPSSANLPGIPRFYGKESLEGWKGVIDSVHEAGGVMGPQIWHVGIGSPTPTGNWKPDAPAEGPSGLYGPSLSNGVAMSEKDIQDTIQAYGDAAGEAKRMGFDTVEIHGAHGYLIDEFFWAATNQREDSYGGKTLPERSRFAIEVVEAVRRAVGDEFTVILRLSQWKPMDYKAKLAQNPKEMEAWLVPLAEAGVDIFHCSQRRFWEAEFPESSLNFAGWAKRLTGKPTITVGSVGLTGEFIGAFKGEGSEAHSIDDVIRRFENGEFDLVAVGRAVLSDPNWVLKIERDRFTELIGFNQEDLKRLT
jgi:2,4-dienoyl-CoA reductase-like NADH-dependent reductase (Old Yellow Enzyme family)